MIIHKTECKRCKRYFNDPETDDTFVGVKLKDYRYSDGYGYGYRMKGAAITSVALCPECEKKLEEWLDNGDESV